MKLSRSTFSILLSTAKLGDHSQTAMNEFVANILKKQRHVVRTEEKETKNPDD